MIRSTIEPMPGSAASRPATTALSVGTAVISRSARRMRSARSTLKVWLAGMIEIATTTKSNTLQGSLKNAVRCTMMREVDLDHEDPDDDVVEDFQDRPKGRHHRLRGLQPERDGVDDDQRHDHALGARVVDDGAKLVEHEWFPLVPCGGLPHL